MKYCCSAADSSAPTSESGEEELVSYQPETGEADEDLLTEQVQNDSEEHHEWTTNEHLMNTADVALKAICSSHTDELRD